MKIELNKNDLKVLLRIAYELCTKEQKHFPEFPELKEEDIKKSIVILNKFGLINYEIDISAYTSSDSGDKYIQENKDLFSNLDKKFKKNLMAKNDTNN